MSVSLIESILWRRARPHVSFRVRPDRIVRSTVALQERRFVPDETYFEIFLSQMFLRDRREYLRSYVPTASFLTEFTFQGDRRVLPFVVGRQLLPRVPDVDRAEPVEFRNIRIAGPFPYEGEALTLFAGLFRTVERDWARGALALLESVAKAFDVTRISAYLKVAGPLYEGVQALLGMADVELRVGLRRSYHRAEGPGDDVEPPDDVLAPAFEVLLGPGAQPVDESERRRYWVINDRLLYGESESTAKPYTRTDFMLTRTTPLRARDDFRKFDFHAVHWTATSEHIWAGRKAAARESFMACSSGVANSVDLLPSQRRNLHRYYGDLYAQETKEYEAARRRAAGQRFAGSEGPARVTEAQLRAVALGTPGVRARASAAAGRGSRRAPA